MLKCRVRAESDFCFSSEPVSPVLPRFVVFLPRKVIAMKKINTIELFPRSSFARRVCGHEASPAWIHGHLVNAHYNPPFFEEDYRNYTLASSMMRPADTESGKRLIHFHQSRS